MPQRCFKKGHKSVKEGIKDITRVEHMDPHFKHQSCASSAFCDSFKSERADRSHHTGTSKSLARVFVKRRSRGASVINHDTNLYLNSICCMFVIHDFYAFCAYKHFHVALEMIALRVLCMCIQYGSIQMICFSQLTKRFTKKNVFNRTNIFA